MLAEIVEFTKSLSEESFKYNLVPKEGLHIEVRLDGGGKIQESKYEYYKKNDEATFFLTKCLVREYNARWVSSNKPLDPDQKFHTCSPFCLGFKKIDKKATEKAGTDIFLIDNKPQYLKSLDNYFKKAELLCTSNDEKQWLDAFVVFCLRDFPDLLKQNEIYLEMKKDNYIFVYLDNIEDQQYVLAHQKYLEEKTFNTDEYNHDLNGIIYGVPDYLNTYGSKKTFLQHHSATFKINNRVSGKDAIYLYKFKSLLDNKQLPNPLPIFIDRKELNQEVVSVFNRDQSKFGYREIIEELFRIREDDLGNYYLLNFQRGTLADFDFVSSFRYKLDNPIQIRDLFGSKRKLDSQRIDNIFDFESKFVAKIFNNSLIEVFNDIYNVYYFLDVTDRGNRKKVQQLKERSGADLFNCILKYRKAFYDFIYKNKREGVQSHMFHEILFKAVINDIRSDEINENNHTSYFSVRDKLNIWFSFYHFFDKNLKDGGSQSMAEQILDLHQRVVQIADDFAVKIETDEEFAYAAGQLIYYLVNQSEAANRTYAVLEPFLQKTNVDQLQLAIARTLDQYKHAITMYRFYQGRFENLSSKIYSYDNSVKVKPLLPYILAGFFAENIIKKYQKNKESETEA